MGDILDGVVSPEASSQDGPIDLGATRRLYGIVWRALRLISATGFLAFAGLYALLLVNWPLKSALPLRAGLPIALVAALWSFSGVGHPLRSVGLPMLALLLGATALSLYAVAGIAVNTAGIADYAAAITDPRWQALLGSYGPHILTAALLAVAGAAACVLCAGLMAAIRLRFRHVDDTGLSLTALSRRVRRVIAQSGDAPILSRRLTVSRLTGWLAAASAVIVLLLPLLMLGVPVIYPDAGRPQIPMPIEKETLPAMGAFIMAVPGAFIAALLLWRLAARRFAPKGRFPFAPSQRPPMLLLRSLEDDRESVTPVAIWRRMLHPLLWPVRALLKTAGAMRWHRALCSLTRFRLETIAARSLAAAGPAVAIGDPGGRPPRLGPFRPYVDDDNWTRYVRLWLCDARFVVLPAGLGDTLRWQLAAAAELDVLHKIVLLMPPGTAAERSARWRHVLESLPEAMRRDVAGGGDAPGVLAVLFDADGPALAITGRRATESDYDLALRIAQGLMLAAATPVVSRVPA